MEYTQIVRSPQQTPFMAMWEEMQRRGYFNHHLHYRDWQTETRQLAPFDPSTPLLDTPHDDYLLELDFSQSELVFPCEYSHELERSVKRNEHYWLPRLFSLPAAGTVLDLGCGFGRSIEWMQRRYQRVIGVDISNHVISLARQRFQDLPHVDFYTCNGRGLPPEIKAGSIDLIYCFTVFQHIPRSYTLDYLESFRRVLNPSGKAIFNMLSGDFEDVEKGEPGTEWAIGYSEPQIHQLIDRCNLSIKRTSKWTVKNARSYWIWLEVGR